MRQIFRSLCLATTLLTVPALAAPNVVVSIKPVHSIVAAVMQGVGEPELLIEASTSEHTAQLKPSQMESLTRADLIVVVGEGLEAFLHQALENPDVANRKIIELAEVKDIKTLPMRSGGPWEAHAHGDEGEADHDHDHEHGGIDPHIWMDPENAKMTAVAIAGELAAIDSANAEKYRSNAEAFGKEIDALAGELAKTVEPLKGKRYIVFHDAYQYFEARFGLDPAGSISVNPETTPGAKRLGEIRQRIKDTGSVCVFAEPQFESKYVATVADGTGARTGVLDGLGAGLAPGSGAYPALLKQFVKDLSGCLGG
jgi:zinc transport system substrate-binding protein